MTTTQVPQYLVDLEDRFNAAMVSNDVARIAACITDDWILVTPEAGSVPRGSAVSSQNIATGFSALHALESVQPPEQTSGAQVLPLDRQPLVTHCSNVAPGLSWQLPPQLVMNRPGLPSPALRAVNVWVQATATPPSTGMVWMTAFPTGSRGRSLSQSLAASVSGSARISVDWAGGASGGPAQDAVNTASDMTAATRTMYRFMTFSLAFPGRNGVARRLRPFHWSHTRQSAGESAAMSPRTAWGARVLLVSLLTGFGGGALAAGYGRVQVPAAGPEPAIQAMVWSPCAAPPKTAQLGPYVIRGIAGCAIAGSALPLVVISHGQGGSFLGHHDTAAALADAGFVVVALNHPGDTFGDDAAARELKIFESRPRDASRVISFMLKEWPSHRRLDAGSVGVFGFSRGGYTALALAGAAPSLAASARRHCGHWWSYAMSLCREMTRKAARVSPQADPRVRAVVVVDPLNLFDGAGLKPVRVPLQLWASEEGGDGVALAHVDAIRSSLPRVPEYHVAKGAGHFAYLAPCPPAFKASAPKLCEDPPGFDRPRWHRTMNSAVTAFFKQHLQADAQARR